MTNQQRVAGTGAIKVLCSNSMHAAMEAMLPEFERGSGLKVAISYDTAKLTVARIKHGETADLVILNTPAIDELKQLGKIVAGASVELARCGVGLAVRAGAPRPDIGSVDAFKRALLAAKSIAYTGAGASGMHFAGLIEQLGIAAQVKAKARMRPGGLIGELVASGEAEIAIQQIPELMAVAGIEVVGPLPPELQSISVIAAGVFAGASQREAAQTLLEFVSSPAAARTIRAKGLEPVAAG